MKHYLNIALSSLVIAALGLFVLDSVFLNNDGRAMVGILTVTGWMSLILFSVSHSNELRKG